MLKIKDDVELFDTLGDESCLETLWTSQPPLFTSPVEDPFEHAEDVGYQVRPGEQLRKMTQILSELMGVSEQLYRHFACKWFHDHLSQHWIAKHWLDQ